MTVYIVFDATDYSDRVCRVFAQEIEAKNFVANMNIGITTEFGYYYEPWTVTNG